MTRATRTLVILLMIGWVLVAAGRAAPVTAEVKTSAGTTWTGELVRRDSRGGVFLRVKDSGAEIGVGRRDIESVEFAFDYRNREIGELIADGDHAGATRELEEMLAGAIPFLDLPNNSERWMRLLLQELYQAGRYQRLREMSVVFRSLRGDRITQEATLYGALARLGLGFPDDAEKEIAKIEGLDPRDELAGMYYYVMGAIQLGREDYTGAQESAARIVAFRAKDLDWLPAGLYLSAQAHLGAGTTNVAAQVLDEIQTVAPQSRWGQAAGKVRAGLKVEGDSDDDLLLDAEDGVESAAE